MHTDSPFYRLFRERPALVFELAGLPVPADLAYRLHAEEVMQTAFRLDGVLRPEAGRDDLPLIFVEVQFQRRTNFFYARWLASIFLYLLVYKFPQLSRDEIRTMLHLPQTELKKTRFYQEVFREGRQEGRQEGREEGRIEGELNLVLRQLRRRIGRLTPAQEGQIHSLGNQDLEALAEALLDFSAAADLDLWLAGR